MKVSGGCTPDESQSLEGATVTPPETIIPYGYCHCGCGEKTKISKENHPSRGVFKGEPRTFLPGHNANTRQVVIEEAKPFKIDGVYCRLIPLT